MVILWSFFSTNIFYCTYQVKEEARKLSLMLTYQPLDTFRSKRLLYQSKLINLNFPPESSLILAIDLTVFSSTSWPNRRQKYNFFQLSKVKMNVVVGCQDLCCEKLRECSWNSSDLLMFTFLPIIKIKMTVELPAVKSLETFNLLQNCASLKETCVFVWLN